MAHINDDDCGHTDEEHQAQEEALMADAERGYLGFLFQQMHGEVLQENLQGILAEIFIRCENDVKFARFLADLVQLMDEVFIQGTEAPEIRVNLLGQRKALADMRARQTDTPERFAAEAMTELNQMIDEHGVTEAPTQREARDDDYPGFYL